MPVRQNAVRLALAGALSGLLTTSGCGLFTDDSGPTSAEAGAQLSKDVRPLLSRVEKRYDPAGPFAVTEDAGKDVPCGDGKAKRTFAANTRVLQVADLDNTLDRATDLVVAALTPTYQIAQRSDVDELSSRRIVMHDETNDLRVTLVLTPTGKEIDFAFTGETGCVRTGS